ncbi:hypothetical protein ACFE04_024623 [Oxalis oulophora]
MANCHSASFNYFTISNSYFKYSSNNKPAVVVMSICNNNTTTIASYNTFVYEAVRLLGPPATFQPSKLKVVTVREDANSYSWITPRTYILSHCDFTADLTLTVSSVIDIDQLKGWYSKDDVVAEWKKVKDDLCLHIHCFVSGPNLLLDLAAEFRYHIFSKEMPLVLQAVLNGDSTLFEQHPELMDAIVRVYFHSSSQKYNRMECWGSLKDAATGRQVGQINVLDAEKDHRPEKRSVKSLFQALLAFIVSGLLLVQGSSRDDDLALAKSTISLNSASSSFLPACLEQTNLKRGSESGSPSCHTQICCLCVNIKKHCLGSLALLEELLSLIISGRWWWKGYRSVPWSCRHLIGRSFVQRGGDEHGGLDLLGQMPHCREPIPRQSLPSGPVRPRDGPPSLVD